MSENTEPDRPSADGAQRGANNAASAVDRYWKALNAGDANTLAQEKSHSSPKTISRGQLEVLELLYEERRAAAPGNTPASRRNLPTTADHRPGDAEPIWPDGMLVSNELRIICLLDRGGMGEVYVAWHSTLNCEVAVKVLPKNVSANVEAIGRFRKTIQAQAKLGGHENIAATMNASEERGRLYLVMEYVPGTNLADYVHAHAPIDWREACRYVRQVASGLQHAHSQGVIHRDIKPSNLIRSPSGTIKILDWGLARCDYLDSSADGQTRSGIGLGTDDYVAPEQARDACHADQRSDLYSLGCTLYFLLTGQAPFAAESSQYAKLAAHESKRPPSIEQFRVDVPGSVDGILRRLMAKRPEERFDSAASLAAALDAAVGQQPTEAGRRPWLVAALGTAVGCSALTWWLLSPGKQPDSKGPFPVETPKHGPAELVDLDLIDISLQGDFERFQFVRSGSFMPTPPARTIHPGEGFRIEGHFREAEAWWILWIDTRGKLDPPAYAGKPRKDISFPLSLEGATISADDPPGTNVLLLITASEQTSGGTEQLTKAFQAVTPAPLIGLHYWARSADAGLFRGAGPPVETAQSYLHKLSGRLPAGFELTAAIFLPWDPAIAKP